VRVLGLDIGERRVGVAVSDAGRTIATPVKVIDAPALTQGPTMDRLIEEYEIDLIVVGLPVGLDGGEGPQAGRVRELADDLARRLRIPVEHQDERLSSAEASRRMAEAGLSTRDMRGKTDMIAAALFLQSYLDRGAGRMEDDDGNA
jgi:putative Holliday junction resolvase